MPRRHHPRTRPEPDQFCLKLDDPRNRPPAAPATPALLETLAELMLAAAGTMAEDAHDDAREDHR